jgi:hypothetical protein
LSAEVERLRRENERLSQRLQQAELIIDIQKSLSDLKHHAGDEQQRQQRLMSAVEQLAPTIRVAPICAGLIEDARTFCQTFFQWYNHDHHHSGISL